MSNRNAKRVRKLKKTHTWIWLIVFSVFIVISCVLVSFFTSVYTSSLVNDRIDAERDTVQNMLDLYETGSDKGIDPSTFLDSFDREYFIYDTQKHTVLSGSVGTCDIDAGSEDGADVSRFSPIICNARIYDANVYPDKETPVVVQDDGEVVVYVFDILKDIDQYTVPSERNVIMEEEIGSPGFPIEIGLQNGEQQMIRIPFWIGITQSDGKSEFVAKSYITVEMQNLIFMAVIMANLWMLVLISYVAMIINIIGHITNRRRTLHIFFTDAVTQGNNYVHFVYAGEEQIRKYVNRSIPYYVVNLSFIGYRNFCVCHSADEGEKVIYRIYHDINNTLKRRKELCARVSDGDFAILFRGGDEESVRARVQAIMDKVAHVTDDHIFVFQAGIDTLEPVNSSRERKSIALGEVYNRACAARESLNSEDSGIAFFDEKLIEDRRWAEAVQERQQAALDNEEFVVYYQPKYDPRTDELRGAEALIRWQSPEFGFVPPGRMIPIFEKNGFITEIDHYMISHVARDQKRWLDAGYKCVPVSVNVSRAHFIESDLAEQIRDSVDAEGAPHELVEIELTESAFFDDKKAMIDTINKLKSYGFSTSMDDFGSGYSSLNSLKDMPLDVLKLDAEFFRGGEGDGRGEIVVSETIKLARSLNMRTVAEGVEVRGQVDFLAEQGCDLIQGYFYAKPMPGEDYETRMKDRFKPKDE